MEINRFKELLESTMGDVRPLVSEQDEPTTGTPMTTGDPAIPIMREMMKVVEKRTPITDGKVESNIKSALKVLSGWGSHKNLSFQERCKKYDRKVMDLGLTEYLPSSEWFIITKQIN